MKPLLLLVSLCLYQSFSHADSDGYYCSGMNYIAYEFSFSKAPGDQMLYIVQFGTGNGIEETVITPLEGIKVNALRCEQKAVYLQSGKGSYMVDLSNLSSPILGSFVPFMSDSDRLPFTKYRKSLQSAAESDEVIEGYSNLGDWASAGKIRLLSDDELHYYELDISIEEESTVKDGVGNIYSHVTTRIVQLTKQSGCSRKGAIQRDRCRDCSLINILQGRITRRSSRLRAHSS